MQALKRSLIIALLSAFTATSRCQTVVAWGENSRGQCNVPSEATNVVAVAAGLNHSLALTREGNVISWGSISNTPSGLTNELITTGAYLSSAVLIYLTLRQSNPEWAVAGTLAFAWNPLVLLESVQNAHNDIVMVFFLAAAIWALQHTLASREHSGRSRGESKNATRGRERSAAVDAGRWLYPLLVCLFLALSILTKFVTALVAPFFLLALISDRRTWKSRLVWLFGYTLFIGGMVVAGMWPLWPGWDTWAVLNSGDAAGRSIVALLILALRELIGGEAAFAVVEKCSQGMFVLIYG